MILIKNQLYGQDIIIKNSTDKIKLLIDTFFSINNQKIKVIIGPDIIKAENTIFFNQPFFISNTNIDTLHIKGSYLQHLIILTSLFDSPIRIDSTSFDTLIIVHSIFLHPIIIRNLNVQHFVFINNTFPGILTFDNCTFKDFALENSIVNSKVNFINCKFENISFEGSRFKQPLNLNGITISGKLNFDSCVFGNKLILSSLITSLSTHFSFVNTTLPDTIDFSMNGKLSNSVDFNKVNIEGSRVNKCNIILYKTEVSNIEMRYHYFKLIFPNQLSKDETENLYQSLLSKFNSKDFEESYKLLDIEYKRYKTKNSFWGFFWWIPEYWWKYGYERQYIFYWVFGFLVLFTFINYFMLNRLLTNVYNIDNFTENFKCNSSRVWYSFIYSAFVFFSLSLKIEKLNIKNKGGTIYILIIYILGLICLAYMANFVIQK